MDNNKLGEFLRKACQTSYCMDFHIMCEVMYLQKEEEMEQSRLAYVKDKYSMMHENFLKWVCQLDRAHLQRFADYVLGGIEHK